ncbi:restriction endonuclease subunit S [Endozoicomonas euniceicola]|uniref:Restriction endonuclease subunit S n=1 Tax=Endozoicomonas euniceicola TaxID=1234143 RepID=A0ABY6GY60_9GAMM|nr:restriction endonuclease subunit S [Endozoicomonas euniceicola]UYM16966.1 restriction endonuclease subunit S [Endozoicomonas euniceicola]
MPKKAKAHASRQITLSELVTIQAGYPFRGSIQENPDGDVKAVQPRDISDLGELSADKLITTNLTGKRKADWLQQGDILFISKGIRHFACYVPEDMPETTLAPSLFLLRVKPEYQGQLNPEFLTWQINQAPVQRYFDNSAEGSRQLNIRKPILAAAPIAVPDIETQNTIARLYAASLRENALLHRLIHNRQQQLNAIANDLISHS